MTTLEFYQYRNNNCYNLFSPCVELAVEKKNESYVLSTLNHKDYHIDLKVSNSQNIDGLNDLIADLGSGIIDFRTQIQASQNASIVLLLYRNNDIEEFRTSCIYINDIANKGHGYLEKGELTLFTANINENGTYTLADQIKIDESIRKIKILAYNAPRNCMVTPKHYGIQEYSHPKASIISLIANPNSVGLKSKASHIGCPCVYINSKSLRITVDKEALTISFYCQYIVSERTYETISHASFDPGPDEHVEVKKWEFKALRQFYSWLDLSNYIISKGLKKEVSSSNDCSRFDNYLLNNLASISISEVEDFLNISFYKEWCEKIIDL